MASTSSLVGRMAKLAIANSNAIPIATRSSMCASNSRALFTPSFTMALNSFAGTTNSTHRSLATAQRLPNHHQQQHSEDDSILATGPDGTQYRIPIKPLGSYAQSRHAPKIAPSIVQKRIAKLQTIEGELKGIRGSPWRMNLVCQFAAKNSGKTLPETLVQLTYCEKAKAPLVADLVKSVAARAKHQYGLLPSQLEVTECFATHGHHLKRIKIMGRGRAGVKHRRYSHVKIVAREIDFPLKIMQATSVRERQAWIERMNQALEDIQEVKREREEMKQLEKEYEAVQLKKEEEAAKKEES